MEKIIYGITASEGIVIGEVYKYYKKRYKVPNHYISDKEMDIEIEKVKEAIDSYSTFLENAGSDNTSKEIFKAHMSMLEDPYLLDEIINRIRSNKNAAFSVEEVFDEMIDTIEKLEEDYINERALDYKGLKEQVLARILGLEISSLKKLKKGSVVVANDLLPSDTTNIDKDNIQGFITDMGGTNSHIAIMAQTLGIPALVGTKTLFDKVHTGQTVIIDTDKNQVIIDPSEEIIEVYKNKIDERNAINKALLEAIDEPNITIDGREINLCINIGSLEDLENLDGINYDGIGLFRTEFLYMQATNFPDEEEQFLIYKELVEKTEGRPVTIRTLDIGGDKDLSYFNFPQEENPFLGWRALRISFDMPEVFKTQIRAILRASYYGKINILLPMVINIEEIEKTIDIIEKCKRDLESENIPFDKQIEVGIMIETPASVIMAEDMINLVDYFSIGTNDLTQYLLAVDRGNQKIAHLYNNYNPSVIRSIKKIVQVAHQNDKHVSMCGGMASDKNATELLIGLGIDSISIVGKRLPLIKNRIRNIHYCESVKLADRLSHMSKISDIMNELEKRYS